MQGFLRTGSQNISVLRVTEQDIFTRGQPMPLSTGHPATPCYTAPPIPVLRPTKTLHSGTSPCHMYPPQVSLVENAQVASSGKTCPKTRRRSCSVDSTLTTHPRHTPRSPQIHYHLIIQLSAPRALSTHIQSPTLHHITDIMRSRSSSK